MNFDEWWGHLSKDGLEDRPDRGCRTIAHMAWEASKREATENLVELEQRLAEARGSAERFCSWYQDMARVLLREREERKSHDAAGETQGDKK